MAQCLISSTFRSTLPRSPTVSIVGSAGRRGDSKKMTKSLFSKMVEKAKAVITDHFKLKLCDVHLVSGGAAWAGECGTISILDRPASFLGDKLPFGLVLNTEVSYYTLEYTITNIVHLVVHPDHVAVVLFADFELEVGQLTLHLPAKWEHSKYAEKDPTSKSSWKSPGQSTNELHRKFSRVLGEDTLEHIEAVFILGAKCRIHNGFQKRNTQVANSEYLIAFTWGEGSEPKPGSGTMDTWEKCSGKKIHIPLQCLESDTQGKAASSLITMPRKRSFCDDIECDGPKRKKLENGAQK